MKLYFCSRIFWKCNVKSCKIQISVRTDTWLSNSRMNLVTVVRFIYAWSLEATNIKWCRKQLGIEKTCVITWNNNMREVCVRSLLKQEQTKIGNDGMIVEIDESLFTKRKTILDAFYHHSGFLEEFAVKQRNVSL